MVGANRRGITAIKGISRVLCVCVCLITRIICLIKNNKLSGTKWKCFLFALWVNFNFLNFSKINCAKCSCKCKTNFHLFMRRTLSPSPSLSVLPSLAHSRFLCRRSLCYCILEMHICHLCTKSIAMLWILMLYMNTCLARYMACTHTYIYHVHVIYFIYK